MNLKKILIVIKMLGDRLVRIWLQYGEMELRNV